MTAQTILSSALWLALVVLGLSFVLTVWRVIKGPTLPDRVVALDMLVGIVIGFIALIAIRTGFTLYIDIAISLGLVGFLATVAFARFILARGRGEEAPEAKASPVMPAPPPAQKTKLARSRKPGAGPAVSRKAKK
jgi:multicomponent Na+:H+ antiporter subunit F